MEGQLEQRTQIENSENERPNKANEDIVEISSIISELNPLLGDLQLSLEKLNGDTPVFTLKTTSNLSTSEVAERTLTEKEKIANVKKEVDKYLEDKVVIKSFSQAEDILYEMDKIKKVCKKLVKDSKLVSKREVEFWCEKYYNQEYTRYWRALSSDEQIVAKNMLSEIVETKNGDIDNHRSILTIGMACVTVFNTALLAFANSSVSLLIRMLEDAAEKTEMSLANAEQEVHIINTSSNIYLSVAGMIILFLFLVMLVSGGCQNVYSRRKRIANRQLNIIKEIDS